MDEPDSVRQFTSSSRAAYEAIADAFITALRHHVDLTLQMKGRQREIAAHMTSARVLLDAERAFDDAEFDWCGSFPLGMPGEDDETDHDDWDDDADTGGDTLSVFGRWDFRITDVAALIDAGRSAYLSTWPDDTQDDADARVTDPQSASMEILHGGDIEALGAAPGLSVRQSATQILVHDDDGDDDFDDDPFGPIVPR